MRRFAVLLGVLVLGLVACSKPAPPAGKWEGAYETNDVMVAARLEILPTGMVRVSAPDLTNIGGASADDRVAMREKLAAGLESAWDDTQPRAMDFDGATFRKPGGIAPQIQWDKATRQMTLVVYFGAAPSVNIPLKAVDSFSANPWPSG